jgi:hypothetical protein
MSLPLLLLLELLHWTHHPNALSIPTLSIPHISISVKVHNTDTPTGHCSTIAPSLSLPYPLIHHAGLIIINTNGLVTTYMHSYHNTGPTPSQRQALGHDTNPLSLLPRYRLPHFSYIGRLLYLHSSTSASEVSHGYYKQIRPIRVDPDPTPRPFLATLVCTALSYEIPVLPILVIQLHSRHGIRTVIPVAIILDLLSRQVGCSSLQDEVCQAWQGQQE